MKDPQPLSVAISELIAKRGLAASRGNAIIEAAWNRVAGENIAGNSRFLFLRDHTIHVAVLNSALLNELVTFHSQHMLKALQSECPDFAIRQLRFQLKANFPGCE
jgi:predicted nucleic acid-binding Zn ribbon protein